MPISEILRLISCASHRSRPEWLMKTRYATRAEPRAVARPCQEIEIATRLAPAHFSPRGQLPRARPRVLGAVSAFEVFEEGEVVPGVGVGGLELERLLELL